MDPVNVEIAATPAPEPAHVAKLYGEPMPEMPKDLYIPPDALEVYLESFEGPLDLLLYLIRKVNINILDIPMARLTQPLCGSMNCVAGTRISVSSMKS